MRIRRPHIIVGTPGRLLSLLQDESSQHKIRNTIAKKDLDSSRWILPPIRMVIFEEADRLLQDNFQRQTLSLVHYWKGTRVQCVFYSATFQPQLLNLTEKIVYTSAVLKSENPLFDDELYVMVDGISKPPPDDMPPIFVLRKCFLVSSYIVHSGNESAKATIPLRMDVTDEEAQLSRETVLDTPALDREQSITHAFEQTISEVECTYVSIWPECTTNQIAELIDRTVKINPDRVLETESVKTGFLGKLAAWLNTDDQWNHWPDLGPKFIVLVTILMQTDWNRAIVFCNDSFSGHLIAQTLTDLGVSSEFIRQVESDFLVSHSSKVTQVARNRSIAKMKGGGLRILVCSDVVSSRLEFQILVF